MMNEKTALIHKIQPLQEESDADLLTPSAA